MNGGINLLPLELRPDRPLNWRRLVLPLAAGAVAALLLGSSLWLALEVRGARVRLGELESQILRLQPAAQEAQQVSREAEQLARRAERMEAVLNERRLWGAILDGLNDSLPRDVWVTGLEATEKGDFRLQGMAGSLSAVGIFLHELGRLPALEQVQLEKAEGVSANGSETISFVLRGRLAEGGGGVAQ